MVKLFFKVFTILLLSTISLLAEYKYIGSFKAGESISGLRSLQSDNSGLEYDFIVEQYGIVEFKPQEPTNNTVQYKIRDSEGISHSYFYLGGAEGITSHGSNSYPDGWRIGLMPGSYKVIVFTNYYDDNPEKYYNMTTIFTPAPEQSPLTGSTLNQKLTDGSYANPASPISLNTYYEDSLYYHKSIGEQLSDITSSYTFINYLDVFSFSLSEESNVVRSLTLNYDTTFNNSSLYTYIKKADGTNACHTFASAKNGTESSDSCKLGKGDYFLEVSGGTYYHNYGFKLQSTPTNPTCSDFSLEKDQQHINMNIGETNYFNMTVCDPVQIMSSDESIVQVSRSQTEYIDEVEVKAISNGSATITVSDKNGVGYLFIDVGNEATTTITTPDTKQDIGNITFLEYEPDGYHSWSESDKFCKERGYRLPTMDELIYVWNLNGKTISPTGFKKDTFYWSSEIFDDSSYKACAMDADCSSEGTWPSDSYGHPKCVVSVNGSLEIEEAVEETTLVDITKANFDDFRVSYCGSYVDTTDGLKVNGSSYRYGNYLRTKKTYDVRDSVTKMRWKADSSNYSYFSPTIVNIASGNMTTNHSYAGSTKIENDTWYYTTITVSGDKVTTVTSKNDYATSGDDVVDSRDGTLTDKQLSLSKNGVEIGFSMGDTYGSTTASFTVSNFSTTAKEVAKNVQRYIILNNNISDVFSDIVGNWSFVDNQLQIVNGNLNDRVILDVSNINGITFQAKSNQNQSNFVVRTLDKDGGVISAVTLDPSTNSCFKDYYLSTTKDVTQVELFFTTTYSIEHYESSYKDIYIKDLKLLYSVDEKPNVSETGNKVVDYSLVDNGDKTEVKVDMGDKNTTISLPPSSDVFKNSDGGITTITPTISDTKTTTTVNKNGTLFSEIKKAINDVEEKTKILVDLVVSSFKTDDNGESSVKALLNKFILNLITDTMGKVTPSYFIDDKEVIMPTFDLGSTVSIKSDNNDVIIEVQTKLTSKITFQR